MRILFIGCVESSFRLLNELILNHKNVVGVITKKQNTYNADFCDISPLCMNNDIPFHYAKNINDDDCREFVSSVSPDICFCFGWSQLLKEDLIMMFPLGVVGFHPAALPNNRGRHPLIWALVLGLEETASSFFMITPGADEGDIVSQKKVIIDYEDDARTLYNKIMTIAVEQEIELVDAFEKKDVTKITQNLKAGNTWRKRGKGDGQIDWRMNSRSIYYLVRGLTKPYGGAHFVFEDIEYKVWKVQEINHNVPANIEPGKVLEVNDDGSIDVKVSEGAVRLIDFEKPNSIKKGDYIL